MNRTNKLIYAMQVRMREMLDAKADSSQIKPLEEELAYVLRRNGQLKVKEEERIRVQFGLQKWTDIATQNILQRPTPMPVPLKIDEPVPQLAAHKKEPKGEELWYIRFCIHCDRRMEFSNRERRFQCINPDCFALMASQA